MSSIEIILRGARPPASKIREVCDPGLRGRDSGGASAGGDLAWSGTSPGRHLTLGPRRRSGRLKRAGSGPRTKARRLKGRSRRPADGKDWGSPSAAFGRMRAGAGHTRGRPRASPAAIGWRPSAGAAADAAVSRPARPQPTTVTHAHISFSHNAFCRPIHSAHPGGRVVRASRPAGCSWALLNVARVQPDMDPGVQRLDRQASPGPLLDSILPSGRAAHGHQSVPTFRLGRCRGCPSTKVA